MFSFNTMIHCRQILSSMRMRSRWNGRVTSVRWCLVEGFALAQVVHRGWMLVIQVITAIQWWHWRWHLRSIARCRGPTWSDLGSASPLLLLLHHHRLSLRSSLLPTIIWWLPYPSLFLSRIRFVWLLRQPFDNGGLLDGSINIPRLLITY